MTIRFLWIHLGSGYNCPHRTKNFHKAWCYFFQFRGNWKICRRNLMLFPRCLFWATFTSIVYKSIFSIDHSSFLNTLYLSSKCEKLTQVFFNFWGKISWINAFVGISLRNFLQIFKNFLPSGMIRPRPLPQGRPS